MKRWKPIETAPSDVEVSLWIKSERNPEYQRRGFGVKFKGEFIGPSAPNPMYGEYASHWMHHYPSPEDEKFEFEMLTENEVNEIHAKVYPVFWSNLRGSFTQILARALQEAWIKKNNFD